ncbi:unnamed protein product [Tenebrio molitor]|jgi:hypothetical protein|nr:unnamed protein product [Tenebrio molitor]
MSFWKLLTNSSNPLRFTAIYLHQLSLKPRLLIQLLESLIEYLSQEVECLKYKHNIASREPTDYE